MAASASGAGPALRAARSAAAASVSGAGVKAAT
jgi:hypothetical protein